MADLHFLLLLLTLTLTCHVSADLAAETAALLKLQAAVRPSLPWNSTVSTCSWPGVTCETNTVVILRLPGSSLSGVIPAGIFGSLGGLRTLSLRLNHLSGELPADLADLTELRNLYLQGNRFSGEIPDFLSELKNLVRLNLAGNNFTGKIPASFNNLTRLATLYLESNPIDGEIPDLDQPTLAQFNVSYTNLNGSIPLKLRSMSKSSFLGTTGLCGGPLGLCPGETIPTPAGSPAGSTSTGTETGTKKKKLSGGAIAGIAIACVIGALILIFLVVLLCKMCGKERKTGDLPPKVNEMGAVRSVPASGNTFGSNGTGTVPVTGTAVAAGAAGTAKEKRLVFLGGKESFDLEDLLRASAEVLGKGTFGTAYKAVMETGAAVAVKRLKDVELGEAEFREKVEEIGRVREEKWVVPLMAYYFSRDEKLLVYEYVAMGSLSALLHGNRGSGRTPLNWPSRYSISLSSAHGLAYIHSLSPSSSHGNLKSSNILLTSSSPLSARVSDHGLCALSSPLSPPSRLSGYRAPEVTDPRKVSQKADVYSFGVLILELLTGKAPTQTMLNEEGVDLPRWVQSVVREEWTSEVFDVELVREVGGGNGGEEEEEMVRMLQLGIDCTAQHPDNRPQMGELVERIEEIRRGGGGMGVEESVEDDRSSIKTE